jgi:hypothetical protein
VENAIGLVVLTKIKSGKKEMITKLPWGKTITRAEIDLFRRRERREDRREG